MRPTKKLHRIEVRIGRYWRGPFAGASSSLLSSYDSDYFMPGRGIYLMNRLDSPPCRVTEDLGDDITFCYFTFKGWREVGLPLYSLLVKTFGPESVRKLERSTKHSRILFSDPLQAVVMTGKRRGSPVPHTKVLSPKAKAA